MDKKFILIDVSTKEEFAECHIPGATNIPIADFAKAVDIIDRDVEIVVYSGKKRSLESKKAWHILSDLGFYNIYEYVGGIYEWLQKKLPCNGICTADYSMKPDDSNLAGDRKATLISAEELKKKLGL